MWIMLNLFVNNALTRWVKFEALFWIPNFEKIEAWRFDSVYRHFLAFC